MNAGVTNENVININIRHAGILWQTYSVIRVGAYVAKHRHISYVCELLAGDGQAAPSVRVHGSSRFRLMLPLCKVPDFCM